MKNVLKEKHFADVEEVKQRNDGSIKRHHFTIVPGLLRTGENASGLTLQMENSLKAIKM